MKCARCGSSLPKNARVCPSCGEPARGGPRLTCGKVAGILMLLVGGFLGVVIVLLYVGRYAYRQMPKEASVRNPTEPTGDVYALSADQQAAVAERGYPEAFTILFYEELDENGAVVPVRHEVWSYYTSGAAISFLDGQAAGELPLELSVDEIETVPYRPEQFAAFMSLDELLGSTGLLSFLIVPTEPELVLGGEVYHGDQITFGLKNDELLSVETHALVPEG
jgi:hypothetical protein